MFKVVGWFLSFLNLFLSVYGMIILRYVLKNTVTKAMTLELYDTLCSTPGTVSTCLYCTVQGYKVPVRLLVYGRLTVPVRSYRTLLTVL